MLHHAGGAGHSGGGKLPRAEQRNPGFGSGKQINRRARKLGQGGGSLGQGKGRERKAFAAGGCENRRPWRGRSRDGERSRGKRQSRHGQPVQTCWEEASTPCCFSPKFPHFQAVSTGTESHLQPSSPVICPLLGWFGTNQEPLVKNHIKPELLASFLLLDGTANS